MSSAFNIPAGWREAIAEIRNGLNDATPSAFDNSGYRDYAGIVLDAVEEELSALAAAPPVDAVPGEPVARDFESWWESWPFQQHKNPLTKACAHHGWRAGSHSKATACTHCNGSGDDCDGDGEGGGGPWCEHCSGSGAASVASRAGSEPAWWQSMMLAAAAKSGDAGTIRLAAQLAGCLPCPDCDFIKSACRCGAPIAPAAAAEPSEPDMRAVCDALGFDPTNHHNAAKCPYCRPDRERAASLVASEDTKRLDWLETSGEGTVEIFRFKLFDYEALKYEQGFVINKGKAETSLRAAIDAARASAGEAQS
jgi:hypothetical protein